MSGHTQGKTMVSLVYSSVCQLSTNPFINSKDIMRNVPDIGLLQVPSVETKSPVKQRPYSTPKVGYTGRQSFYINVDGTVTNSLEEHKAWDKEKNTEQ